VNAGQIERLIRFVTERLDDDERVAREAGGDRWVERGGEVVSAALAAGDYGPQGYWVASSSFSCEGESEALHEGHGAHIARHDPARALRDVEAKRRILAGVAKWLDPHPDRPCTNEGLFGVECELHAAAIGRISPEVLPLLAMVWTEHPDFDEAWRPA